MLVGTQKNTLAKQVYVFTLMSILSVVRGRTNTRKGGQLIALATNGRKNTRLSQRNKQNLSRNVFRDHPLSNVELERSDYGPDSAHTRDDDHIERDGDGYVRTAEQPNIQNVQ